jgi:hypothetical protein
LKTISKLIVLVGMLALAATPSLAAGPPADTPPENHGTEHKPTTEHKPATPGPRAGMPAKAKAYGRFCKGQSKKRSDAPEGTKGTPFSQCVTAMAKLATGKTSSPRTACKEFSKKRSDAAEGTKGTPFSQCVSGGAKLLREQKAQNGD